MITVYQVSDVQQIADARKSVHIRIEQLVRQANVSDDYTNNTEREQRAEHHIHLAQL